MLKGLSHQSFLDCLLYFLFCSPLIFIFHELKSPGGVPVPLPFTNILSRLQASHIQNEQRKISDHDIKYIILTEQFFFFFPNYVDLLSVCLFFLFNPPLQGKEQHKPEVAPLHIQNPFESSLNVSKNVNASQLDRFIALCQETSWLLQQSETMTPRAGDQRHAPAPWGLASLLLPSQVVGVKSRKKKRREPASERIKGLLESLKNNKSKKN